MSGNNKTLIYTGGGSNSSFSDTLYYTDQGTFYGVEVYGTSWSVWGYSNAVYTPKLNSRPSTPGYVTITPMVTGQSIKVEWGASTDSDGNLSGYILQRSANSGGSWTQVYKGSATQYTDTVGNYVSTVAYRVKAYDSAGAESDWRTSTDTVIPTNKAPTVALAGAAALGQQNAPFEVGYTVADADGDTLTVTETLDGVTTATHTGIASGTALTVAQTSTADKYRRILNGDHALKITVSDGKASTSADVTFTKSVHAASITLAKPMAVSDPITVAVLAVTGSIPADATYKVEATNNALDDSPVWQDVTTQVQKGTNIVFANSTAAKGPAFNFRVSVARGPSGIGGYIESVSGAFQ